MSIVRLVRVALESHNCYSEQEVFVDSIIFLIDSFFLQNNMYMTADKCAKPKTPDTLFQLLLIFIFSADIRGKLNPLIIFIMSPKTVFKTILDNFSYRFNKSKQSCMSINLTYI